MSAVITREPTSPIAAPENNNQLRFEALCRLVEYSQGTFSFAPVQFDLPSLQNEVLGRLHERFPDLNLVTVKLTPPPPDVPRAYHVLDQLRDLTKFESSDRAPDALIITNYESLFPEAIKADDGRITDELVRAIQPLNLGRNLFAEAFPCPVLLCLPPTAMGVFLRSAPDLVSWKSGFFTFESDSDAIRAKLGQEAGKPMNWLTRWQLRRRAPEELFAETKRFEALIADGEAMPAGYLPDANRLIARLYHRLGGAAVALKDRLQARGAFAEMLRRAKEAADQRSIGAAERGQRAAEAITTVARLSPPQSAAVQEVFRGAAALTEAEGMYGREEELRELVSRVTSVNTRFLTIWGETGCGKTSLALAGLMPELKRQGHCLPVVVRQWEEPEAAIRHSLAQTLGLALDSFETLRDCIGHVAQQTQKTVVVVCDQFELFFTTHPQRIARQPFIKAVSACVNDLRVPCKFIFILREDHLGRMVEFESDVPEAIEQRKRFYLPLFNAADAVRALRQQADKARLDWPENFVRAVVSDLTREERVRPIELQLVGAALAVAGISNETDFAREGRAQGLMVEYLRLTLNSLGESHGSVRTMKQILFALVAEPAARLALTPEKIARRAGVNLGEVRRLLRPLLATHLIRRVEDSNVEASAADNTNARYEPTHDVLVELVLILMRDLQDKRRQAVRILQRATENTKTNPRYALGLRQLLFVKRYSEFSELQKPAVQSLVRHSFLWQMGSKFFGPVFTSLALLTIVHNYSFHVWQDENNKLIIKRGLPYADYLTLRKGDTPLDTGFSTTDLSFSGDLNSIIDEVQERVSPNKTLHWEMNSSQSWSVLDTWLAGHLYPPGKQELLLFMIGRKDQAVKKLLDLLKTDSYHGQEAALSLGQIAKTDVVMARQLLPYLLESLKGNNSAMDVFRRKGTATALGMLAEADISLANEALPSLINVASDKNDDFEVRANAIEAMGRVAQTDPTLANRIIETLLDALKNGDFKMLESIGEALGQAFRSNTTLSSKTISSLLGLIGNSNAHVRRTAARSLGIISQLNPAISDQILPSLIQASRDKRNEDFEKGRGSVVESLGAIAKVDERSAVRITPVLLEALNDDSPELRRSAVAALKQVSKAYPDTAHQLLPHLLNRLGENDLFVGNGLAAALAQIASLLPTEAVDPLVDALKNDDSNVRRVSALTLGKAARANPTISQRTIQPLLEALTDSRNDMQGETRTAVALALLHINPIHKEAQEKALENLTRHISLGPRSPLPATLIVEAENEMRDGRSPVQFLFDHLEARKTLILGGNANSYADYRKAIIEAMARWLVMDRPEAKTTQVELKQRLERMRDSDNRLHLRIAAWDVFVKAAELRKKNRVRIEPSLVEPRFGHSPPKAVK